MPGSPVVAEELEALIATPRFQRVRSQDGNRHSRTLVPPVQAHALQGVNPELKRRLEDTVKISKIAAAARTERVKTVGNRSVLDDTLSQGEMKAAVSG